VWQVLKNSWGRRLGKKTKRSPWCGEDVRGIALCEGRGRERTSENATSYLGGRRGSIKGGRPAVARLDGVWGTWPGVEKGLKKEGQTRTRSAI